MTERRDIDCPPYAPVLMESTRAIGYSIESAIADIIDNSIAAEAKNISIYFNSSVNPYVVIFDDGNGMTGDKLTESMRYGSCNPTEERQESDLGRYGLGMKTASLSQCRCLTVASKKDSIISARRWDLDHIIKTERWSLEQLSDSDIDFIPEIQNLKSTESGTIVVWQSLDKIKSGSLTFDKALEEKMNEVKVHLELVFHRFLAGDGVKKIAMSINGVSLVPFDPFFVAKSTVVMDDEKIDIPGRKGRVIIRPYVLPHPSNMSKEELERYGGKEGLRSLQGFYIYRNKRLLTWGTWFNLIRKDEFSKLARVKVDIPNSLDDLWVLDIKKSTAYPPEIVKTRLKQLVGTMANSSKRTWTFRQKKETQSNIVHVWDVVETREGIRYVVNQEHPVLENLLSRLDDDGKKLLKQYLETVQNNLPFNNLHHDMHSDVKIIQDKENVERDRVVYMAKEIMREAIKGDHIEQTMKGFETLEPFSEYMDEIRKAYKEVCING